MLGFESRAFGENANRVTSYDWEVTISAMGKGPNLEFLRRLFFPNKQDYEDGNLTGLLAMNRKWFTEWTLPQLGTEQVYLTGPTRVYTRRPGFLAKLTDKEYHAVFTNLQSHTGMTCPTWYVHYSKNHIVSFANKDRADLVYTNKTIAQPMKKVLQHVIYWTDQTFLYPKPAASALKTWNWLEQLEKYVFRPDIDHRPWRLISEDAAEDDERAVIASLSDHVREFMDRLWHYIGKEPLWRGPAVLQKQVCDYLIPI